MSLIVLDPTPDAGPNSITLAPALGSLAGARIGLLDNGKVGVRLFLDAVEKILWDEHSVAETRRARKKNQNAPAPREMIQELATCDAVISAVGD